MTMETEAAAKKGYTLTCISDALALLGRLFDAEEGMSLKELTLAAKLSKNKTFRLLDNFERTGVVEKDHSGRYYLGATAFTTARKVMSKEYPASRIRSVLERLAGRLDEAAYFATISAGHRTLLEMADCSLRVRARSFVGAVLAPPGTGKRTRGNQGETVDGVCVQVGAIDPEITTVSVDVADNAGAPIGSLVVLAPSFRMPRGRIRDEIVPALKETLREMHRQGSPSPSCLPLPGPRRDEADGSWAGTRPPIPELGL